MGFDNPTEAFQLRRIQFVPAQRPDITPFPTGLDIVVLNGVLPEAQDTSMKPGPSNVPKNTKELFREQDVSLRWKTVQKTGTGLQNLGNTCFMNSVLQCLTHTPPLAEALLASKQLGSNKNFDPLRLTQQQVVNSLQNKHKNQSVAPTAHAKSLRQISKSFRLGRQEDAHEYLVALLDAMHESYINMCRPKPSPELSKTSMIYQIFAGRIRSQVKCTECGHESNTYDVFLDLSLEINRASSLLKALQRFTSSEYLDGANKYICPKQKQKVRAAKCMTIDKAPAVLVVQLKRFEFSMFGHKINKKVDFDTDLDLGPFMSNRRGPAQPYSLYGVLVHSGHSVHSGHYYAFVKAPNGLWHQLDDNHVSQVSERVVLAQKAYILFYIKNPPTPDHPSPSQPLSPKATNSHSAQLASNSTKDRLAPQPALQNGQPPLLQALRHAQANSKASKAASAVVYGPAERPMTGSTSATKLCSQLLAPPTDDSTQQQQKQPPQHKKKTAPSVQSDAAAVAAAAGKTAQGPKHSIALQQSLTAPAAGLQSSTSDTAAHSTGDAPSVSQQAVVQQAGALAQAVPHPLKASAKRKADALGGSKRPSVLQRMQTSSLGPASDTADMPLRKRQATGVAAAASSPCHEEPVSSAVRRDAPGNATQSSGQVCCSPAAAAQVGATEQLPCTCSQEKQAATASGRSVRHSGEGLVQAGKAFASPASVHDSPVLHGSASAVHSPRRRPARNVLFPSPQSNWQGRSWNRLNMHHHIHRSRQLSSAGLLPHAMPASHPRRSLSASPDKVPSASPARAFAAATLASGATAHPAEQPLPQEHHSSSPAAAAADARQSDAGVAAADAVVKPRVKRQLLTTATAVPGKAQHNQPGQTEPKAASDQQLSKALAGKNGVIGVDTAEAAAKATNHSIAALQGQSGSAENLGATAQKQQLPQQVLQQDQAAFVGGKAPHMTAPASVKEYLRGRIPPNSLATWEDVEPDLAKQAASLNRPPASKKRKGLDDWDAEYDKGKLKKVKSKRGGPDAWQQSTDVFGKVGRSRGRGGFRGGSNDRGGKGGSQGRSGGRGGRGGFRGRSGVRSGAGRGGGRGAGGNRGRRSG